VSAAVAPEGASCPEVQALREETVALRRELEPYFSADTILAQAAPNPELERRLGAVIGPSIDRVGRCGHQLECRGDACRLTLLVPLALKNGGNCFDRALQARLRDYVGPVIWGGSGKPVWDPLSRLPLARVQTRYRLVSPDAAPIPIDRRPPRPPLTILRHRPAVPLPSDAPARCRDAYQQALSDREALERIADRDLEPDESFATDAPNPGATAAASRRVEQVLGAELAARLVVECRGSLCRVTPRAADDPLAAIGSECHGAACVPAHDDGAWFHRLAPRDATAPFWTLARSPYRTSRGQTPPYYRLTPDEDRGKLDGMAALHLFTEPLKQSGFLQDCERHFPASGRLALVIRLTEPDGQAGSSIQVDYGDELGGSALGRCIAEAVNAAAARFQIPPHRGGAVINAKLDFPGARQGRR
jgi:hypothetical protein